ncbi:hypothetical protein Acr_00g0042110 [Actinidia rufa]|uniref:Uncharacterized protein n=1 Tax=Actinidia rufa TaxID=165716 RepID=A0A7J0DI69_9ERIC|nr:hypothetical protein Acr_00g0042110 [Actinidia rufa]
MDNYKFGPNKRGTSGGASQNKKTHIWFRDNQARTDDFYHTLQSLVKTLPSIDIVRTKDLCQRLVKRQQSTAIPRYVRGQRIACTAKFPLIALMPGTRHLRYESVLSTKPQRYGWVSYLPTYTTIGTLSRETRRETTHAPKTPGGRRAKLLGDAQRMSRATSRQNPGRLLPGRVDSRDITMQCLQTQLAKMAQILVDTRLMKPALATQAGQSEDRIKGPIQILRIELGKRSK